MFKVIEILDNDKTKEILVNLNLICMVHPAEVGSIIYLNGQYVVSTVKYEDWSSILKDIL